MVSFNSVAVSSLFPSLQVNTSQSVAANPLPILSAPQPDPLSSLLSTLVDALDDSPSPAQSAFVRQPELNYDTVNYRPPAPPADDSLKELKDQIASLTQTVQAQSKQIDALTKAVADKDDRIEALQKQLNEKNQAPAPVPPPAPAPPPPPAAPEVSAADVKKAENRAAAKGLIGGITDATKQYDQNFFGPRNNNAVRSDFDANGIRQGLFSNQRMEDLWNNMKDLVDWEGYRKAKVADGLLGQANDTPGYGTNERSAFIHWVLHVPDDQKFAFIEPFIKSQ